LVLFVFLMDQEFNQFYKGNILCQILKLLNIHGHKDIILKNSKYIVYLNCCHLEKCDYYDYKEDMENKLRKFLDSNDILIIIDNTQSTSILEV